MPRVDIEMETPLAPDVVREALLDFTERRPEIWPGIEPRLYEVYEVADTWADIREGSKMPGTEIWAIEHYDWSDPETVRWTVRRSNFCAPGSYVSATITPDPAGGSRIHLTWNRTPTSLVGRISTLGIRLTRGMPVKASMQRGLARLEASGKERSGSATV